MRWCGGERPAGRRFWANLAADAEGLGDDWIVCGCARAWECDPSQRAAGRKCERCGGPRPYGRNSLCSDECAAEARRETHARYEAKQRELRELAGAETS